MAKRKQTFQRAARKRKALRRAKLAERREQAAPEETPPAPAPKRATRSKSE
jgi:hypothetical protein